MNSQNVTAHFFKGFIFDSTRHHVLATKAYQRARAIQVDVAIYQGLVNSFLAVNDIRNALKYAKEAQKIIPFQTTIVCLPALAYGMTNDPKYRALARKIYMKVLESSTQPCLVAVTGLATLNSIENKSADAVKLLKHYLDKDNSAQIHTTLADILAQDEHTYHTAIIHYDEALKINPLYEAAERGKKLVEKLLDPGRYQEQEEEEQLDGDDLL
eukprot:TRINITY_DN9131_c0_g1_i1.p1 TRINITY_DN9131_c0_g1~~TRINITY_DN9131_c0_g1_i1.p1  ORF type:complete len:213 (-),score=49.03 TRINITY_DN9131_c0_g1_i1:63-701(-)